MMTTFWELNFCPSTQIHHTHTYMFLPQHTDTPHAHLYGGYRALSLSLSTPRVISSSFGSILSMFRFVITGHCGYEWPSTRSLLPSSFLPSILFLLLEIVVVFGLLLLLHL